MFLIISLILCATVALFVRTFLKRKFNYWKERNVPHQKPTSLLGDHQDYILLRKYVGQSAQDVCRKFPNEPYIGTYYGWEPALLVQDPDIIKTILTKDFYYFNSREVADYTDNEVTTRTLFFTHGNRWKALRHNMTPIFSSAKLKNMFYLIQKRSVTLEKVLDKETAMSPVLEMRTLCARYTMDCIGSCAFGVETDTLNNKTDNNLFTRIGNAIFDLSPVRAFKIIARVVWPKIFYGLGFKTFSTEIDAFFTKLLVDVFESRHYTPSSRNDFVDLILSLKKDSYITGDSVTNMKTGGDEKIKLKVDTEFLVGQCVGLFAAGYDTSAATMSFTLYELAKNKDAQKRVIAEIDEYLRKHDNKIEFDCLSELMYLDACIHETMRLYPVVGLLTREVTENYTLPTGLRLEKDMRLHIPTYHLHRNPEYFPEPEAYKPERFLGDEKRNIKPYTYLPFGEGPRMCLGRRFAKMQMIPGLMTILKKYRIELADGMPSQLALDPKALGIHALEGINLNFIKREDWEQRVFKMENI